MTCSKLVLSFMNKQHFQMLVLRLWFRHWFLRYLKTALSKNSQSRDNSTNSTNRDHSNPFLWPLWEVYIKRFSNKPMFSVKPEQNFHFLTQLLFHREKVRTVTMQGLVYCDMNMERGEEAHEYYASFLYRSQLYLK